MNNELRERDLLWCKALVATLGIDEIARVTAEFNRIRPDKAVEQLRAADGFATSAFGGRVINDANAAWEAIHVSRRR